jgi:hypothetical protein
MGLVAERRSTGAGLSVAGVFLLPAVALPPWRHVAPRRRHH